MSKGKSLKALIDVVGGQRDENGILESKIPARYFGEGKSRILRKMVLIAIAASADADGTGAWPSRETLAERCLVSVRAIGKVLNELEELGLLIRTSKAHRVPGTRITTNGYVIRFPDLEQEEIEVPGVHQEIDVPSVDATPGTTGVDTRNNSTRHQEQFERHQEIEVPPTALTDRPIRPPSLKPKRENKEHNNNNNSNKSGKRTNDAAVAAAVQPSFSSGPEGSREITAQELIAKMSDPAFIGEFSFKTTASHRKEALQVAQKFGPQVFLAAFKSWWETSAEKELSLGTDHNGRPRFKTWPLLEFLRSGSAMRALQKASLYGEHDPLVVAALMEEGTSPDGLTDAHYAALGWLERNRLLGSFQVRAESKDITAALIGAEELLREATLGEPWQEYAPLARKLLEQQPVGAQQ